MTLDYWMNYINEWAESKGWNGVHKVETISHSELMNFHSEISEAWEELRKGKGMLEVYFPTMESKPVTNIEFRDACMAGIKPEGFPIEIADLVIRILHTCAFHGIDIEKFMLLKMVYNETRPYRHGGKVA